MSLNQIYKDFKAHQHETKEELQNAIEGKDLFQEEFPSDVFPKRLMPYIKELSNESGYAFDPAFVGLSILKTYATAIGSYYAFKTHFEDPVMFQLFGCIVGISSSGKSIVEKTIQKPLKQIDKELYKDFETQTANMTPEEKNNYKIKTIYMRSAHIQTMVGKVMKNNPKGFIRAIDEISEFFNAIDAKKSSADAGEGEIYMSIFNGDAFSKQLSNKTINIPFTMMTMVGSTQPTVVHRMFKNDRGTTGFIYRFLFVVPRKNRMLKQNIFYKFPEELSSLHSKLVKFLYNKMPVDDYEGHEFRLVYMNNEAKKVLQKYFDQSNKEVDETNDIVLANTLSGIKGKLSEYIYKFTGILAIMDYALEIHDNKDYNFQLYGWPQELEATEDHVNRAIRLINYFERSALEVTKMATDYVIVDAQVQLYLNLVKSGFPMWKRGATLKGVSDFYGLNDKKKAEYAAYAYRQEAKYKQDYPEHFKGKR